MKFFHLSDLHFGKQLHGYDTTELHRDFIAQTAEYARKENPDAILISGDIYDKSVPSATAMTLLDELLVALRGYTILIIAGNHDSGERLRYGQRFLEENDIHISVLPPQSEGEHLKKIVLHDEYGDVNFYMLPFVKPGMVRSYLPEEAAEGEEAVIKKLIDVENVDRESRNVILSHQFYVNCGNKPETCDSEQSVTMVGGLDAIDISVLDPFDYAALGHIHGAQSIGKECYRYCGTPLKYSVSEADHNKSITVVTMGKKGDEPDIKVIPIKAKKDVKRIKGTLREIIESADENTRHDFVSITITDEDIPDKVKDILEGYFDNILEIIIDNKRSRQILEEEIPDLRQMTPYESFAAFFSETAGREMDEMEDKLFREILTEVGEVRE